MHSSNVTSPFHLSIFVRVCASVTFCMVPEYTLRHTVATTQWKRSAYNTCRIDLFFYIPPLIFKKERNTHINIHISSNKEKNNMMSYICGGLIDCFNLFLLLYLGCNFYSPLYIVSFLFCFVFDAVVFF